MYIYEEKDWPTFIWDQAKMDELLIPLHQLQGRLLGRMESIGFSVRDETLLKVLTQDVVKSSEIEGEFLDQTLVRSSVARHLGIEIGCLDPEDRRIEGVVEMILDATQACSEVLTKDRILRWHTLLFPQGRSGFAKIKMGNWRQGPVDVVSGRVGKEIVHFEAPPADRVENDMRLFLEWANHGDVKDLLLKAAVAHLWFVTIHPFEDGNGRIGRAIADLFLSRSEMSFSRFYSLSAQIQKERKMYYAILEKTQKGNLDITSWIEWFLGCLKRAIEASLSTLDLVIHKAFYWDRLSDIPLNERQRKIIDLLLEGFEGKLTTSKWAKINKCSQDTAYRDILQLIHHRVLQKNLEGGRSTSYGLTS